MAITKSSILVLGTLDTTWLEDYKKEAIVLTEPKVSAGAIYRIDNEGFAKWFFVQSVYS